MAAMSANKIRVYIIDTEKETALDITGFVSTMSVSQHIDGLVSLDLNIYGDRGIMYMFEHGGEIPFGTVDIEAMRKTKIKSERIVCPFCGSLNPSEFLHCGEGTAWGCGGNLTVIRKMDGK